MAAGERGSKPGWVMEGDRGGTILKGVHIYRDQDKPLRDQAFAESQSAGRSISVSDVVRRAIDEYLESHPVD